MAIDPYLEQQYNNRAAVPEHSQFLQDWLQRSEALRARASHARLDVPYGERDRMLLDIFPATQANAPVHLFAHGGYWQALSKDSFSFLAEHFNAAGECAVIINYDLCPAVDLDTIIAQIRQALRWVYRHIGEYGGDPSNMQASGHSAGAHLIACLMTDDYAEMGLRALPLKKVNAISGLYDLTPLVSTSTNQGLGLNATKARLASPVLHTVTTDLSCCALDLYVGEQESEEYWLQSNRLRDHWQSLCQCQIYLIEGCHHFSVLDGFLQQHYHALDVSTGNP